MLVWNVLIWLKTIVAVESIVTNTVKCWKRTRFHPKTPFSPSNCRIPADSEAWCKFGPSIEKVHSSTSDSQILDVAGLMHQEGHLFQNRPCLRLSGPHDDEVTDKKINQYRCWLWWIPCLQKVSGLCKSILEMSCNQTAAWKEGNQSTIWLDVRVKIRPSYWAEITETEIRNVLTSFHH